MKKGDGKKSLGEPAHSAGLVLCRRLHNQYEDSESRSHDVCSLRGACKDNRGRVPVASRIEAPEMWCCVDKPRFNSKNGRRWQNRPIFEGWGDVSV